MKKVLLVGATGQLGTSIYERLAENENYSTRILIREDSKFEHLKKYDPEVFIGDLRDKASLEKAVQGCDVIITTANSAAPRKKEDSFQAVDIEGYRNLIDIAKKQQVEHFIYTSAIPVQKEIERWIPLCNAKAQTESYLKESGLTYTIFQPDAFMDIYFTFCGTSIPAMNEPAALVHRPFKFMQNFYNGVKDDVEKGKFGIIGSGETNHHYITIENVTDFIVGALEYPALKNKSVKLGGPQGLTALEVKAIFEKVLDKPLKIKRTPAVMMKIMGGMFSWFNEGAANILKLNYWTATNDTHVDCSDLADKMGIQLISAEEYLRSKLEREPSLHREEIGAH